MLSVTQFDFDIHEWLATRAGKMQFALAISLVLAAILTTNHLWHNDLLFHTDLARDFLVLEDIVKTQNPTLLGPRSGGIPGVFHGPLWYYLNLLPFWLTAGNPILMGWWWWLMGVTAIFAFLAVSWRVSQDLTSSLLGSLGFTLLLLPLAASPVNNYLADIGSFLVFASWVWWYHQPRALKAAVGWLGLGLLVQFQMAWAVPIALAWTPFFILISWQTSARQKNYRAFLWQLASGLLFLPPLATFLLFELRHDWLQVRSVLTYISQPNTTDHTLWQRAGQRLFSATTDGLNIFRLPSILAAPVLAIFAYLGWKTKRPLIRTGLKLFGYWYCSWWFLSLGFSGTVWSYYFSPFFGPIWLGLVIIARQSKPARVLLGLMLLVLVFQSRFDLVYRTDRFGSSSWQLLNGIAQDALAQPNLGYFVYAQDQFAYSLKYAFGYYTQQHPELAAEAFVKKPQTVLVKSADNPLNPYSTSQDWQENRLNIKLEPTFTVAYPQGYQLERYQLDQATIDAPVDPNLITNLHFR